MKRYLREFETQADYNAALNSLDMPNVSLVVEDMHSEFNPYVCVSGVSLNKTELELSIGETVELVASVMPANATDKRVVWSSSDDSVATVDDGYVTAIETGNVTISVVTVDGSFTSQCNISISAPSVKNNEIWYTSSDGNVVNPASGSLPEIVSNTYVNGKGVIKCSSDITTVGNYAFENCSTLTSITLSETVTKINISAFKGCTQLTGFTIPDGVTDIGWYAFEDCTGLTSITIPSLVTNIGYRAFNNCANSLISISVSSNNSTFDSRNNCNAIIKTSTNSLVLGCRNTTIPSSVTGIEERAFNGCARLSTLTLPSGVTSIGDNAFLGCGMTSVVLPDAVTYIGHSCFRDCTELTSITFGTGLTNVGEYILSGCSKLASITSKNTTPPHGGNQFVFSGLTSYAIPVYVPSSSINSYKSDYNWRNFTNYKSL